MGRESGYKGRGSRYMGGGGNKGGSGYKGRGEFSPLPIQLLSLLHLIL